ncbi:hypothetical protein BD309DRAFT_853083 [Dichomitus squalens]|uniref:Uncharacterized protein n=2 Tax=Dichomitus squalens TaxID=114155 RepID=A0A4Q9P329_9APHY|nr:uncharacterized protein DICSQDRAFT_171495 [Dichomitus squalens LYAD-421 SS1]EJF60009.1 hypothetical protein DICSQDRAFT_171495 [Dichomitus squalens LYAD-421 SS1]TBU29215.1 hypothetical protein BD311DRAFT_661660 [Dichomitus squalens]TBU48750.1 hypothetical protein BD309DRAFT_853083 [Dichomitus squalens]TBU57802.1 hypothetical protein BD310DRAFT_820835 [Dichomitus squalens]
MTDCALREDRSVCFGVNLCRPQLPTTTTTRSHNNDMQFKALFALASFVSLALAAPADVVDAATPSADVSLTTHLTTDTFTATRVLESLMTTRPFITTVVTNTVWTVTHTVTREVPTGH